ncbi:RidA family protein [Arthrobacter russicus]|uniref:2-iminobutanoate/2-iminopropanoate deaminase n=1 Tax=Arthrobacter russicus TaxID=172040 RepID=A0ABU1JF70_9MICC|nr:RidA family protein [Arthrobacter russicus]MDN5667223.1 RidA family protein [Renibacterium salmoninarum]MDR6270496.1 2-iminobutanoate/2-iminopropanoate deaminase [Arthrobacter russicus]
MSEIIRGQFDDGKPRPYSASASFDRLVFLCGQVPTRPDGSCAVGITEQLRQAFDNLEAALANANSDLSGLLKLTVYLADLDEFEEYNAAYLTRLHGYPLPPRTTVQVARFRGEKRIEIDAIAAVTA